MSPYLALLLILEFFLARLAMLPKCHIQSEVKAIATETAVVSTGG